ncbi:MAG: response regulator transcription factor [Desulfobacterales bacterium]|nr:response regulator transcription factor [Desulfobacterales bacterium]
MRKITAIIADDEKPSRTHIRTQLSKVWPELEIRGEAENGEEAIARIQTLRPDIAFLDIKMPGLSGIEAARRVAGMCRVVFITAYDQYAIDAFESEAVDYILKPASIERLAKTVQRIKTRIAESSHSSELFGMLERMLSEREPGGGSGYLKWIKARVGGSIRLIPVDQICYFQSNNKYTLVATPKKEALIRKPISELADELDPDLFFRIHRGAIVNAKFIEKVTSSPTGRGQVKLAGRSEILTVSRSYTSVFKQM